MEILENRAEWLAKFQAWEAPQQIGNQEAWLRYPFAKNKTAISGRGVNLRQSRLALISSAGGYLRDSQKPFDAPNPYGDYSLRVFPTATPFVAIAYAHDHYDHAAVETDPQVLLPLRHLETMVAEGIIGALTPSVVSIMGYLPDLVQLVDTLFPQILAVLQAEGAQAALLVPS